MKNKKLILLFCIFLLLIAVVISVPSLVSHADDVEATQELETKEQKTITDWINVAKEKILPTAVSILLGAATLYAYLRPILLVIKNTAKGSKDLQTDFEKYKKESDEMLKDLQEKLNSAIENLNNATGIVSNYENELKQIQSENKDLMKMLSYGFGNSSELVRKGAAKSIVEIAKRGIGLEKESDDK